MSFKSDAAERRFAAYSQEGRDCIDGEERVIQ